MKTFLELDLPKSLQKAIEERNLMQLTPIQEKVFPVILSGRDIMGIAQTGTGKTLAYLVPILKQWRFLKTDIPRVVILVPTRELVVQVVDEIKQLTQYMQVRVLGIYGGVNINTQKTAVYEGIDIVVGTPGRTMDLALDGVLRLDGIQKLVIDEFDEILNLGFRFQVTSILSMLKNKRQNLLFSATMTDEVNEMLEDFFEAPEEVSLAPSGTPLEKITQNYYSLPNFLTKINLLIYLLQQDVFSKVLLFVNQKKTADLLFEALEEHYPEQFGIIHSNKSQNYRLETLAQFEKGMLRGIVTTDVMARGLDISNITHVFNVEFPEIAEQYIHRIGRTGRADKEGIAISFVSKKEEDLHFAAEVLMEKEITLLPFPENVIVSEKLLEFEKDKKKFKFLLKKPKLEGGSAFQEKKDKNKKVNLGGPGKRNPKKTKPSNRAVERKRATKRKNK